MTARTPGRATSGTPHVYDADRLDLTREQRTRIRSPYPFRAFPSSSATRLLVNGLAYPFLEVEPAPVPLPDAQRNRQARFLNPRLVYAGGRASPTTPSLGSIAGPAFVQFGTEGGFLPAPVYLSGASPAAPGGASPNQLLLAPAERADLIVDFRSVAPRVVGSCSSADAPGPYPEGEEAHW